MHSARVHLYLWAVAFIYGANYTIAKSLMPEFFKPEALIAIRVSLAALLFILIDYWRNPHEPALTFSQHKRLFMCAVFGVMINQLFFFKGLSLTSPSHASLIMTATPILVLIISWLMLRLTVSWIKILGVLLGFSGAAWLIFQGETGISSLASPLGDVFILINAASYGLYLVLAKPMMVDIHPIRLSKWVFVYASPFMLLVGLEDLMQVSWANFDLYVWMSIGYVILFTTVIAYALNALAIRLASPELVGSYIYLQPILAIVIALFLGKDKLGLLQVAAGCMIFLGVFMVSRR